MHDSMDDDPGVDAAARARIAATRAARSRAVNGRTPGQVRDDLTRAWVRLKLGQNRGEVRPYHGSTAGFDSLLDELALKSGGTA